MLTNDANQKKLARCIFDEGIVRVLLRNRRIFNDKKHNSFDLRQAITYFWGYKTIKLLETVCLIVKQANGFSLLICF